MLFMKASVHVNRHRQTLVNHKSSQDLDTTVVESFLPCLYLKFMLSCLFLDCNNSDLVYNIMLILWQNNNTEIQTTHKMFLVQFCQIFQSTHTFIYPFISINLKRDKVPLLELVFYVTHVRITFRHYKLPTCCLYLRQWEGTVAVE